MKVGIIGIGNMGTILSEALLAGKAISPSDLSIINRTKAKAEKFKDRYQGVTIASDYEELVQTSNLIFLCMKPKDFYTFLNQNSSFFRKDQCLVSITSPIQTSWLEKMVPSSCVRLIPSITNRALSGVTLFTFGLHCTETWRNELLETFSTISTPILISEEITRVSSDIVSCGPAFFSYITRQFIDAAVSETKIDGKTAEKLFEQMLIGLGDLLKKGFYSLSELEEKVCVKGGITGEGINVLENELGDVFEKVFQATHKKYAEEVQELKKDFVDQELKKDFVD
ncbi:late competence protein ComER [Lederbergia sp. NSJ-179]|uniref:late competence protein ComER n=1 Tax=Lederbergia sp. NSJ-179 TaxID=2931402 RepID=UPI001FD3118D|nr:late competence protein ComER [Lederbergia sp. NSJ-179]MCJ7841811.1 late competence protein ComER [Lederbergia sp. NSJ-179]